MNILSQVIENVTKNYYEVARKYNLSNILHGNVNNDFNNYINMVKSIDDLSYSFSSDLYKFILQNIDDNFFNSDYRKRYCNVIGYFERNIWTLFGEVSFSRRYYHDRFTNKNYFFTDKILMFPKHICFDPFVCAKVIELSSIDSMAKAGRSVSELIGKRLKFINDPLRVIISRSTARNIVHNFKIPLLPFKQRFTPSILYVMLDEKFVHSQFNDNNDFMVKSAVIFEDVIDEYKSHPKNYKPRLRLTGKRVEASIDNNLDVIVNDYIFNTYNTDLINEIVFMGDCASWIKAFPNKGFKYHKDLKITFSIDGFHYVQALEHICTQKYNYLLDSFKDFVMNDNKQGFINLCNLMCDNEPYRKDTIIDKQNYILNNWKYIQNYYHKVFVNCSMESHISHIFADIFTSRPRAYSKSGLRQILKLRLLRVNGEDIQKIFFNVLSDIYSSYDIPSLIISHHSTYIPSIPFWLKMYLERVT